jgi:hypothetical protein
MNSMIIAIDFDGTCTSHEFPAVGNDIGAAEVLRDLVRNGCRLILYTMRCDFNGDEDLSGSPTGSNEPRKYLTDAIDWFTRNRIPLYGIQTNPTQNLWTKSPKCYADLYIDDAALGIPLMMDPTISERPFVDWKMVRRILISKKIIR